jgi:heme/copper-type cytochrome/quinol oxidase subunit 4
MNTYSLRLYVVSYILSILIISIYLLTKVSSVENSNITVYIILTVLSNLICTYNILKYFIKRDKNVKN